MRYKHYWIILLSKHCNLDNCVNSPLDDTTPNQTNDIIGEYRIVCITRDHLYSGEGSDFNINLIVEI